MWKAVSAALALLLWQFCAMTIHSKILLVSPIQTLIRLATIWLEPGFWQTVMSSLGHIALGYFLGALLAIFLAVCAYRFMPAEKIFGPWMAVIRSVPVASFVIICLIWLSSSGLAVFIAFLMVVPILYQNLLEGLKSLDQKKQELADVYHFSHMEKGRYVILPQMEPFLMAGAKVSLGLAWKAGIAAEIIGTPAGSIGKMLYTAKIYLDTDDLMAWTVVTVLLSVLFEKLILLILKHGIRHAVETLPKRGNDSAVQQTGKSDEKSDQAEDSFGIKGLKMDFGRGELYHGIDRTWKKGGIHYIYGPSGSGKTTLLRILCGLQTPDDGTVFGIKGRPILLFQEDVLCEDLSGLGNVMLIGHADRKAAETLLDELGLHEALEQKVREYSGGMKRRCALAAALLAPGEELFLDEPFRGLDEANKQKAAAVIRKYQRGRSILLVTHEGELSEDLPVEKNE